MNSYRLFLIISCCFLTTPLYALTPNITQPVEQLLKRKCLAKTGTAVRIVSVPDGKVVFERNTEIPLLPASTMKVVTTAAALHYLGPEYRFKTRILHTGERRGNTIYGDLVIKGSGDPKLSSAVLREIAAQLRLMDISAVNGRLVADDTFFDDLDRAPAWKAKRSTYRYDAGLSALSLNFNSLTVHIKPGKRGGKARVWLNPAADHVKLRNLTETVGARSKNTIWATRKEAQGAMTISVRGRLPRSAGLRTIPLNVTNPTRYAVGVFRSFLEDAGIRVSGTTAVAATSISGRLLYEHHSPPLSLILKELNTYSNNFVAEQTLKTMAAEQTNTAGSHENGLKLVRQFLRRGGVDLRNVMLADGSGLSRNNRMTVKALTQLLAKMPGRFDIGPDFVSALRVLGANGTASKRFRQSPARGQVRAKTGTLTGVSTLAGYVPDQSGDLYAYALFLTDNRCGHAIADRIEDGIVNLIFNGR